MKNRFSKLVLLLVLFSLIIPQSILADNQNSQPDNSKVVKQLVMGYADCWRNSAGKWTDAPGYDGTIYPALQPDTSIPNYSIQVGYVGNLTGTPILENVELAPSSISQELYNSFSNKDNIVIANTGYGPPINIPNLYELDKHIKYSGTISGLKFKQNGTNADIVLNNVNLITSVKDMEQAVPSGISGKYLANHSGNAPTVQGRRIFFPLIVTWKIQDIPDLKVWIDSPDMAGNLPGDFITIKCSVKNLSGSLVTTDIGVAEFGLGWNPPTIHGPLIDIPIDGNNYNFSFKMRMPETPKTTSVPPAV